MESARTHRRRRSKKRRKEGEVGDPGEEKEMILTGHSGPEGN